MQLRDVARNYDRASKHYDSLMDIVFGRMLDLEKYRERSIDLLGDLDGATVLDVGCGTGRNFPLLVERVGARGRIIGLDCSAGMLREAGRLVERNGWSNIELMQGDAVTLEGIPEPLDAIVATWCYGTVEDLDQALHRAADMLDPGGKFSVMSFARSRPERGPLRFAYPVYRLAALWAGFDMAKEFDNASLKAKWEAGRRVLSARFEDCHEESYLSGAGIMIAAGRPRARSNGSGGEQTGPGLVLRPGHPPCAESLPRTASTS